MSFELLSVWRATSIRFRSMLGALLLEDFASFLPHSSADTLQQWKALLQAPLIRSKFYFTLKCSTLANTHKVAGALQELENYLDLKNSHSKISASDVEQSFRAEAEQFELSHSINTSIVLAN